MTSEMNTSRRAMLGGIVGLGLIAFAPAALALSQSEAEALVSRAVADVNKAIASGQSASQLIPRFEAMLAKYGDMPIIARSALGQPWKSASAAQQSAYVKAFQGYVARKYGSRFKELIGAEIGITRSSDRGKAGWLVTSNVNLKGRAPFVVDWQVSDRGGSPKLINMFVEGISMLSTEQQEMRSMLEANGGNIDRLVAALKKAG